MECGNKLPDNAKFCFNCGSRVNIQSLVKEDVGEPDEKKDGESIVRFFQIDGLEMGVNESISENVEYKVPYIKQECESKKELLQYVFEKVNKFDDIYELLIPECLMHIEKMAGNIVDELIRVNVFDYDNEKFLSDFKIIDEFLNDIEIASEKYNEIIEYAAQIDGQRNIQRSTRSHWQGGGFGLGGAIKGAFTAGILNAGTGVLRGIGDSFIDSRDRNKIIMKKKEIYDNGNLQSIIINATYNACERMNYSFCCILKKCGLIRKVIPIIDEKKLNTQIRNLEISLNNGNISEKDAIELVIQWMEKNPFSILYYDFFMRNTQVAMKEIDSISDYFGYLNELQIKKKKFVNSRLDELEKMSENDINIQIINKLQCLCVGCDEISQVDIKRLENIKYRIISNGLASDEEVNVIENSNYSEARVKELMSQNNVYEIWNIINKEENAYAEWSLERYYTDLVESDIYKVNFDSIEKKMDVVYELSDQGNEFAQYLVCIIRRKCYKQMKNSDKVMWMDEKIEKLAEKKQVSACAMVGFLYYKGDDYFKKNSSKAFQLLKYSADRNHPMAMAWLGTCYLEGDGGEKNTYEARKWLELATYYGNLHAEKELKKL